MQQLQGHLVGGFLSTTVINQLFSFNDNYSTIGKNNFHESIAAIPG